MKTSLLASLWIAPLALLLLLGADSGAAAPTDTLIAGVSDDIPPMVFRERGGDLVGYDVDLLHEIGRRIHKTIRFKVISWADKEQELADKSIDFIASQLSITEERKKILRYTLPIMQNFQAIIVPAASSIQSKNDLDGKAVCVLAGSFVIDEIHQLPGQKAQLKPAEGNEQCLVKLLAGEVDASVLDGITGTYYSKHNPGAFRILSEDFGRDEYAYGMRQSDAALVEQFNQAIAAIEADGTMKTIRERWFGAAKKNDK